jgi:hypothetical protein
MFNKGYFRHAESLNPSAPKFWIIRNFHKSACHLTYKILKKKKLQEIKLI